MEPDLVTSRGVSLEFESELAKPRSYSRYRKLESLSNSASLAATTKG
jgi:hypothetical protein